MIESFLLTVVDGVWTVRRAENTSANYYQIGGPVPPDELPPALDIGLKAIDLLRDGYKFGKPELQEMCNDEQREWEEIKIELVEIEPPEPTGLAYLRSLTVGTRFSVSCGQYRYMVINDGLVKTDGTVRFWSGESCGQDDDWRDMAWVAAASPETCPPWTPEEK